MQECRNCHVEMKPLESEQSAAEAFITILFECPECGAQEEREVMKFSVCTRCSKGCPSWREGWEPHCYARFGTTRRRIDLKMLRVV